MYEIKLTGICKGCTKSEFTLFANGTAFDKEWHLICEHEDACKRLEKMLNEKEASECTNTE